MMLCWNRRTEALAQDALLWRLVLLLAAAGAVDAAALAAGLSRGWLEETNPLMVPLVTWLFRTGRLWALPFFKACYCFAMGLALLQLRAAALRRRQARAARLAGAGLWFILVTQAIVAVVSVALLLSVGLR